MRQLAHKAIGVAFWAVLVVLWVKLVLDHKAGGRNIAYSLQYLAAIAGAVLAVTFWWIRHNTGIYQRKGPRNASPAMMPRIDEDRLGRPIRWQLDGGVGEALDAGHLIVDLDGEAKVYRRAA
jgi:membrane protease YdiL (CAAX protease family)